jgi:ATP/maltotriose-dependent transcriptional regulator MalT
LKVKRLQIQSKKFYPPRFDPDRCLYRLDLIEKKLGLRRKGKRFFFVEAQAGQGKTTLIQQYLKRYEFPFSWYQVGAEDHDPVYFVKALIDGLSRNIQQLALPQMEQLLSSGEGVTADLPQCLEVVRQQLDCASGGNLIDRRGRRVAAEA